MRRRRWSWLGAGVVLSCAAHRPVETQSRPANVAIAGIPDRTECKGGDTRLGERACSARNNAGLYRQHCIEGRWQETGRCVCTGTVKFASASLERKILASLKLEAPLSAERAAAVSELKVIGANIDSLEGLECFYELKTLNAGRNRVTDVSPLAELEQLTKLQLYDNRIHDLGPLAKLGALVHLSLDQNEVWDIGPLASLTRLAHLGLYDNHVADLSPLRAHKQLRYLNVSQNCIGDLSPLGNLSGLEALSANFNGIVDASPVRGMRAMLHLFLAGNRVAQLEPISELPNLRTLFVDSNGLREVSALTLHRGFELLVIERNPIDCKAQGKNIETLELKAQARGGRVGHDCSPKRQRALRLGLDREFEVRFQTDVGEHRLTLPETHKKDRCAKPATPK